MADVSHIVTLGIGTPADIGHFVLVGLSPNLVIVHATAIGIGVEALAEAGTAVAHGTGGAGSPWVGYEPRDLYAPRLVKKRLPPVRVDAVAIGIGVEALADAGIARARGTTVAVSARAVARPPVASVAAVTPAVVAASASAQGGVRRRTRAEQEADDAEALRWILEVAA